MCETQCLKILQWFEKYSARWIFIVVITILISLYECWNCSTIKIDCRFDKNHDAEMVQTIKKLYHVTVLNRVPNLI